jgi:hypothetical protein
MLLWSLERASPDICKLTKGSQDIQSTTQNRNYLTIKEDVERASEKRSPPEMESNHQSRGDVQFVKLRPRLTLTWLCGWWPFSQPHSPRHSCWINKQAQTSQSVASVALLMRSLTQLIKSQGQTLQSDLLGKWMFLRRRMHSAMLLGCHHRHVESIPISITPPFSSSIFLFFFR